MTTYQWLLLFHVLAAFLFVSGAVVAGLLQIAAIRAERPSEVVLLLRLTRPAVLLVALGSLAVLALGLALVAHVGGYSFGEGWIVGAIVLWAASMALGGAGGRRARHTRYLAERLAAEGDAPSEELDRRLTDPVARLVNYASLAAAIAILVLMVWKPGA